jgi:iron complex outermembrane receptor protein
MFAPYNYDNYRTFNGHAPGYAISSQHGELSYTRSLGKFAIKAALKLDREMQQRYQIVGDTVDDFGYNDIFPYGTSDTVKCFYGYYQNHFWQSTTFGANLQGEYSYKIAGQDGYVLLGADFNRFYLMDSNYSEGDKYGQVIKTYDEVKRDMVIDVEVPKNLAKGQETMIDCYLQLRQNIGSRAILNAGVRYDYKRRNASGSGSPDRHVLSPRIAFIYKLLSWNLKASYSKSFVDAPYFYRNATLDIAALDFWGNELEPEYMDSWQLSVMNNQLVKGLTIDANFYYNHAKNIIYNDQAAGLYTNAGYLKSIGVELALDYRINNFTAHGNLSWQNVLETEFYTATGNRVYNVPPIQSNIVLAYKFSKAFKLHANTTFTSKQVCQSIMAGGMIVEEEDVPARAIFNAGGSYDLAPLTFEFNVYNLFNKNYSQGGNCTAPIRQQGLWFMFNVGVKL